MSRGLSLSNSAATYWNHVDKTICQVLNKDISKLAAYKQQEVQKTRLIGEEGIAYWNAKIVDYQKLTQKEAVKRLIKAEKIETKISTIRRAIQGLTQSER